MLSSSSLFSSSTVLSSCALVMALLKLLSPAVPSVSSEEVTALSKLSFVRLSVPEESDTVGFDLKRSCTVIVGARLKVFCDSSFKPKRFSKSATRANKYANAFSVWTA